jgi:DNA-binding transcriptional MerR regulator
LVIPGKYSIKDLETLSKIKSHTIRIWEKRYSMLSPARTDTNIRYYTNEDLKKILNISFLNHRGIKISKIAGMSEEEIIRKVQELQSASGEHDDIIEQAITAMLELDEQRLVRVLQQQMDRLGMETVVEQIIFPFLKRIGLMWQTGTINPAQEHFVSNIIRQKLISATDALPTISIKGRAPILLMLPESELHELSLLYYNYALRAHQYPTIYLGQAVPLETLHRVLDITQPKAIVSVWTNASASLDVTQTLHAYSSLPNVLLLFSGAALLQQDFTVPSTIHLFKDLDELLDLVQYL